MFLTEVLGSQPGHVQIVTGLITEERQIGQWFSYPDELEALQKYVDQHKDEDVWFSVNLYSEPTRRIRQNMTVGHAVYMDADTCTPDRFRVEPSYAIETSEGRWHCYWVLDREYDAKEITETAHRISVAHIEDGCDKSGWIPTKILRYPGTTNTKSVIPYRVRIKNANKNTYTLDELNNAYSDITTAETVIVDGVLPDVLPNVIDLVDRIPFLIRHLYEDEVPKGGSWSERMWALQTELFRVGWTAEEVFVVSWQARCNKYHPNAAGQLTQQGVAIPARANAEETLWREVLKAQASVGNIPSEDEDAEYVVPDIDVTVSGELKETSYLFLDAQERQTVQAEVTFIDEFVDWVAGRSDASQRYTRSLAWMLLSCAYGDYGYVKPKFGAMNLNLFLLILGDSTYSRKSTAVNHFYYALGRIEYAKGESALIGNDFTPEALNAALRERDGQVSVVVRDEVHGMFEEMYRKAYLTGLDTRLTDLYDGKALKVLRMSNAKDKDQKDVTAILNFIGIGIREELASVLTAKNFQSGFLARFVWAVTDRLDEITEEQVYIEQGKKDEEIEKGTDVAYERMIAPLESRIAQYKNEERTLVSFSDEAWERFNQWGYLITGVTKDPRYTDLFDHPAALATERLRMTVLKCAAMLALHEGAEEVHLNHMLHALAQAELWYTDMRKMADDISASSYQKLVDDVERYIATGRNQKRTRQAIHREFASYTVREIDEWVSALMAQGRITGNALEVELA